MREENSLTQYGITEVEFESVLDYSTYIYNGKNVFVDTYDLEAGELDLVSCDETPLDKDGSILVTLTLQDFMENYYK